jgi:hypothetical protein
MQDYITKDMLVTLGINLKNDDADSLIAHFNEVAEELIGDEIMNMLSDDEIGELMDLQKSADDEEIGDWIAAHVPAYDQIVNDNIDIAVADLVAAAEGISKISND